MVYQSYLFHFTSFHSLPFCIILISSLLLCLLWCLFDSFLTLIPYIPSLSFASHRSTVSLFLFLIILFISINSLNAACHQQSFLDKNPPHSIHSLEASRYFPSFPSLQFFSISIFHFHISSFIYYFVQYTAALSNPVQLCFV